MKYRLLVVTAVVVATALSQTDRLPAWAYGTEPPEPPPSNTPEPPDFGPHHIADCNLEFTIAQIRNPFGPADWFPSDHPPMPPVVANGSKPDVYACSFCHYPNGKGRPENAGVSGLPVDYFIQTMNDFKTACAIAPIRARRIRRT